MGRVPFDMRIAVISVIWICERQRHGLRRKGGESEVGM